MQKPLKSINNYLLLILFFLLVYLLFPTQNSSIDAYNYAANLKWHHDLFFPHHLLYNYFQNIILETIHLVGFNPYVLGFMKAVNAIFAALCLIVFSKILKLSNVDSKTTFNLILLAGSCFGFLRYATENETYIIPLFWSLLASLFYLKYLSSISVKHLLLSGLSASIACLFHQIHFFWYAGLLLGIFFYRRKYKEIILMLLPSVIIPIIYYWAYKQNHTELNQANNLLQFILYDYYFGSARVQFGFSNFVLGFIGFVRGFIQIHGMVLVLFKKTILYTLVFIPVLVFAIVAIVKLFKYKLAKLPISIFIKTHIIIFVLQFGFAIFSEGNAEFMIMLPFLSLLIINRVIKVHPTVYFNLAMAILIWNFTFALFPNNHYDYDNNKIILNKIKTCKKANFILSESSLIQNMLYYESGILWRENIYKSPSVLNSLKRNDELLKLMIDSSLNHHVNVYTDCIKEPIVMNRKNFYKENVNENFFKKYKSGQVGSFTNIIGTKYIYTISKKQN